MKSRGTQARNTHSRPHTRADLHTFLTPSLGSPPPHTLLTNPIHTDATFEDGIMHVTGHAAIAAQFCALPAAFKAIAITATAPPRIETGFGGASGGPEPQVVSVSLPTQQAFKLRGPFPLNLTLQVDTRLALDPAGKVARHTDAWRRVGIPGCGGRTLPLPGGALAPAPLRALNGTLSTRLLRLAGFGKGGAGGGGPTGAAVAGGNARAHQD